MLKANRRIGGLVESALAEQWNHDRERQQVRQFGGGASAAAVIVADMAAVVVTVAEATLKLGVIDSAIVVVPDPPHGSSSGPL